MHTGTLMPDQPTVVSLADRFFDWRNRLLMSRRFQRAAASFPLTRRISSQSASAVFDVVAGFVYSQVLLACVQLKVFERLADGAKSKQWLSKELDLSNDAVEVLLEAACALKLLQKRTGDRYGLGMRGAPLVGNLPVLSMIEHHRTLYADLRDPVALLRRRSFDTAMASYWPYSPVAKAGEVASAMTRKSASESANELASEVVSQSANEASSETVNADQQRGLKDQPGLKEQVALYSSLMAASQPFVADEVLEAVDFSQSKRVLDVGGGEGEFLSRLALHAPHLHVTLFDLPEVALRARARFERANISARAQAVGGSFLANQLPTDCDVVTLLRVIHDHDDTEARQILAAVRKAVPVGGRLILAEPMAETPGAAAMGHAYFGFYLWAMGRGRSRSAQTITNMLKDAGFTSVSEIRTRIPMQARILVAR